MAYKKTGKARVIKDYEASDPDPLVIQVGERVYVGKRDTTWPVFLRCRNEVGNEGWVPDAYLEIDGDVGVAVMAYSAVELTVKVGDVLTLEKEVGGWYWAGKGDGEEGWLPVENISLFA